MAYPKVDKNGMATPTGPTGILASGTARGETKAGGKRSMGGSKGLTCSPFTKRVGRKVGK